MTVFDSASRFDWIFDWIAFHSSVPYTNCLYYSCHDIEIFIDDTLGTTRMFYLWEIFILLAIVILNFSLHSESPMGTVSGKVSCYKQICDQVNSVCYKSPVLLVKSMYAKPLPDCIDTSNWEAIKLSIWGLIMSYRWHWTLDAKSLLIFDMFLDQIFQLILSGIDINNLKLKTLIFCLIWQLGRRRKILHFPTLWYD